MGDGNRICGVANRKLGRTSIQAIKTVCGFSFALDDVDVLLRFIQFDRGALIGDQILAVGELQRVRA
jgi:hypothetical protein